MFQGHTCSVKSGHSVHWTWLSSLIREFRERRISWNSSDRSLLQSTSEITPAFTHSWVIDRRELIPSFMRDIRCRSTISLTSTWVMLRDWTNYHVNKNLTLSIRSVTRIILVKGTALTSYIPSSMTREPGLSDQTGGTSSLLVSEMCPCSVMPR